jgi:hypothetical protein
VTDLDSAAGLLAERVRWPLIDESARRLDLALLTRAAVGEWPAGSRTGRGRPRPAGRMSRRPRTDVGVDATAPARTMPGPVVYRGATDPPHQRRPFRVPRHQPGCGSVVRRRDATTANPPRWVMVRPRHLRRRGR